MENKSAKLATANKSVFAMFETALGVSLVPAKSKKSDKGIRIHFDAGHKSLAVYKKAA